MMSHPSWVCGLKPILWYDDIRKYMSHPSWVCGLKLAIAAKKPKHQVTPFVGVWIETQGEIYDDGQVRVTPFVGVWIETYRFEW